MTAPAVATAPGYFATLYGQDDPFGYRTRWYEARKRALLLASLPHARYASAWEAGCSNGELTAALAPRCDRVLATDLDARAVALAQARTAAFGNVDVACMHHPLQWPAGQFDLIVFSEVGYYFDPPDLAAMVARMRDSLASDGVLVACHWLHPFSEAPLCGHGVHAALASTLGPAHTRYRDADLRLETWSIQDRSVAQREALR